MPNEPYSRELIDEKLSRLDDKIDEKLSRMEEKLDEHGKTHHQILQQVTYTNGKVKKLTLWLTITGTATATVLVTNGSEFVDFILKIL